MSTTDQDLIAAGTALSDEIRASGYGGVAYVGAQVGKPGGGLIVYHEPESPPLVGDTYRGFPVRTRHVGPLRAL